jgi:hypothetical protein
VFEARDLLRRPLRMLPADDCPWREVVGRKNELDELDLSLPSLSLDAAVPSPTAFVVAHKNVGRG